MRVCLLSPGLPGTDPADAVGRHAAGLAGRAGWDVVLALTEHRPGGERGATLGGARVLAVEDAIAGDGFDVAIATDWTSTARLFEVPAARHAYWVDDLAHHRIGAWNAERIPAQLSYDLPVDFLAASEAVAAELSDLRPARWPTPRSRSRPGRWHAGRAPRSAPAPSRAPTWCSCCRRSAARWGRRWRRCTAARPAS